MVKETITPDRWEEIKQEKKALYERLMALKEAAHQKGMRYLSDKEFDEIWAEERAGGEGFNRVWNY
jgi:hypothetical protein